MSETKTKTTDARARQPEDLSVCANCEKWPVVYYTLEIDHRRYHVCNDCVLAMKTEEQSTGRTALLNDMVRRLTTRPS